MAPGEGELVPDFLAALSVTVLPVVVVVLGGYRATRHLRPERRA